VRLDAHGIARGTRGSFRWRAKLTLLLTGACVLAAGLSCPSQTARPVALRQGDRELVIFLTGNELGSLRPCGCSGGQLGGVEKRSAVFSTVPSSNRLTIGTGGLVANDGQQDLIKFRVFFEALGLLRYDMVCLTDQDQTIAESLGLLSSPQAFAVLKDDDGVSRLFTKQFPELGITVNVASFDPQSGQVEQAAKPFHEARPGATVDLLILRQCDKSQLEDIIADSGGIDCILCPPEGDEPHLLSEPDAKPLVVSLGRYGRHIGRLRVAIPASSGQPTLQFEATPVTADLPDEPALVQLYRQYQQLVSDAGLLEDYPRIPLPDGLSYTGSEDCRRCHEYEYDEWGVRAHADALTALKKVGSDRDPECVICHVVGLEYEGGYVSEEKTPQLKDVGCETCHGPGSEHAETDGVKVTRQPQLTCLNCHTPDRSSGYAGHEDEYLQKIIHWREPATAGNVKD